MDVEIRPARPDEAPALSELALRSKGHWGYDAEFLAACRKELRIDAAVCDGVRVVSAFRADMLAGFYRLAGEAPVGDLADLFVDPPMIGTGIGGRLLAHALRSARRIGFEMLTIDADPNALPFYFHAGAVQVGEVASASIEGRRLPRLELRVPD